MKEKRIHGINVSYDYENRKVREFVDYLDDESRKEEFKAYCHEARRSEDKNIRLNDRLNNEYNLICRDEYHCTLMFSKEG